MKSTYFAVATAALVGLAACASESTSPGEFKSPTSARFAVGALTNSAAELGVFKVCKTGNAGGSFDVSRAAVGASTGTVSGLNTLIATGECRIVAEDGGGTDIGSTVTISEDAADNTVSSVTGCVFISANPLSESACAFNPANRFLNSFHGHARHVRDDAAAAAGRLHVHQGLVPQQERRAADGPHARRPYAGPARAIFDATPGKPGDVTWGADND